MGIHLPVQLVERVEGQRRAATVEQREAGVSGTGGAPPDGRQVGDVLREHHLGVPLQGSLFVRIEIAGQPAQVAVQRSHFVLRFDRHQAGAEQHVAQGDAALLQLGMVAAAHEQSDRTAIELVLPADQAANGGHVLAGVDRGLVVTNGLFRELLQMPFQHVLRRHHHGDTQQRILGHAIEQGVQAITLERLAGEMPCQRRLVQLVDHDHSVWHGIEQPYALGGIGNRLPIEQVLGEVGAVGQRQVILQDRFVRPAYQFVEAT